MSSTSSSNNSKKPLIIFCHGSGDTGPGVQAWIESLVPPGEYYNWDWLFPTAKPIPYQLSGGAISSIWYDRVGGFAPTFPEQTASIEQSTTQLMNLIDDQIDNHGRSPNDIIIGGFSMGGAISYQTAARWHARSDRSPLGAVFGLSCYLNHDSKVWSILNSTKNTVSKKWPQTFIAHGAVDDFILPDWGKTTSEKLKQMGVPIHFQLVPNAHHEMTPEEIADLLRFLKSALQDQNSEQPEATKPQEQKEL